MHRRGAFPVGKQARQLTTRRKIKVYSDDGRVVIGVIRNGVFRKCGFQSRRHICRRHNAIGLDRRAFLESIKPNAMLIVCPDSSSGIEYKISVADFEANAIEDDLGCGLQLFCPLQYWQKTNSAQLSFGELLCIQEG